MEICCVLSQSQICRNLRGFSANILWPNMCLCYLNRCLQLWYKKALSPVSLFNQELDRIGVSDKKVRGFFGLQWRKCFIKYIFLFMWKQCLKYSFRLICWRKKLSVQFSIFWKNMTFRLPTIVFIGFSFFSRNNRLRCCRPRYTWLYFPIYSVFKGRKDKLVRSWRRRGQK